MDILVPARLLTEEFRTAARAAGWEGGIQSLEPVETGRAGRLKRRLTGSGTARAAFRTPDPEAAGRVTVLLHAWPMEGDELTRLTAQLPELRWVHTAYAGAEMAARAVGGRAVLLTNAGPGSSEMPVEHATALLLAMARGLPEHFVATARREWSAPPARKLGGATVLVIGLGGIGSGFARNAAALGCRVIGLRRRPELGAPEGVEELIDHGALRERLAECDYVLLAVPATDETRDLVNADFLAHMKPGSVLLNVGRGETVVEDALAAALHSGHLGGACLDVTREEPLAASSPLYEAPGLWLTHHTAYRSVPGAHEARSQAEFLANLARFVAGEPLNNLVNPERGY
jgi:phosphoglycerate dehydrogenase-like enzyme